MMSYRSIGGLVLFFCLWLGQSLPVTANTIAAQPKLNIPLTIKNEVGVEYQNPIVTSGIPFPQSAKIKKTKVLCVVDAQNNIQPAQFKTLSRWNGKPKNQHKAIQWVLVDFIAASVPVDAQQKYYVQNCGDNHTPNQPITVERTAEQIDIITGPAHFVIDPQQFDLFHQVYMDVDGDGQADDALLNTTTADGSTLLDPNGTTYTAQQGSIESVSFERTGPIHTILKVKGWHQDATGDKLLAYTARLHFYAGQSYVTVQYGVWNDGLIYNVNGQPDIKEFGSPNTKLFSDLTLQTRLHDTTDLQFSVGGTTQDSWHDALTSKASLYQDSSGGPQWNHEPDNNTVNTFRGFKVQGNDATLHDACNDQSESVDCRALGWIDLTSAAGGVSVGVRDFWQNYPKGLEVANDGTLAIQLFPEQYSADFELRVGEQKTHQVLYYFHAPDLTTEQLRQQMLTLHEPLQAWASAKWYLLKSKTFHQSVPYNKKAFGSFEGYNDAALWYEDANLFLLEDGIYGTGWTYGDRPESLGWRNFGDRIAEDEASPETYPIFTNLQYDHTWFFLYQAVRTLQAGKNRAGLWWELAEPTAYQQADIDTIHSRCSSVSTVKKSDCMDPAVPYIIGWAMGGRLTNQWHAWSVPDIHRNALIDSWAGGMHGLLYYYYLTGDGVIRDAWQEYADNTLWRVNNTPCNQNPADDCGPGYASTNPNITDSSWGRGGAYNIEILLDAYNATGKKKYLKGAKKVVQAVDPSGVWFMDPDFKLDSTAEATGETLSPWTMAMLMKSLGYYLDNYKQHFGKVDPTAQDVLLQYASLAGRLWQLDQAEPTQYLVYETGAYAPETANPMDMAMADGLIWALDYDDGRLDRARVAAVADAAYFAGSHPWGSYATDTFLTTKTHVTMGVNGWRYLKYALHHK